MKIKGLEDFLRFVKDRAYNLNVRKGYKVYVSVFFINGENRTQMIDKEDRKSLSNLIDIISYQNPEKIEVAISSNGHSQTYNYELIYSEERADVRNFSSNDENNRQMTKINERYDNIGLGNIHPSSIESIVNKRLDEERKERKLTEQEATITEKNEIIKKKSQKIDYLTSQIEAKNVEIEGLQKTIESKQNFKYYAGITGDILQSFGIKKEIIATPLAGLLSGGNEAEQHMIEQASPSDESGIIDETTPQYQNKNDTRNEMIVLIEKYLKGLDNSTLSNIFSIFSEIENEPKNAVLILEYINNQLKNT